MFSFFGKKEKKTRVTDRIFLNGKVKLAALAEACRQQPESVIIAWFEDSQEQLEGLKRDTGITADIFLYRQVTAQQVTDRQVFFCEHYPVASKEEELWQRLHLDRAIVYSALDEPLLKYFGGERISLLIQRLGMAENEAIEHELVARSIRNGQDKIGGRVNVERSARSQEEWFAANLPPA